MVLTLTWMSTQTVTKKKKRCERTTFCTIINCHKYYFKIKKSVRSHTSILSMLLRKTAFIPSNETPWHQFQSEKLLWTHTTGTGGDSVTLPDRRACQGCRYHNCYHKSHLTHVNSNWIVVHMWLWYSILVPQQWHSSLNPYCNASQEGAIW